MKEKITARIDEVYIDIYRKTKICIDHKSRKDAVFKIIAGLEIDYLYDGTDMYMDEESFKKLETAIRSNIEYRNNKSKYVTFTQLNEVFTAKYGVKIPILYNVGHKPYNVQTENYFNTISVVKKDLERIGVTPVTVHSHSLLYDDSSLEIIKESFLTIDDIVDYLQEKYSSYEGVSVTQKVIRTMFEKGKYYDTAYKLNSYRLVHFTKYKYLFRKEILGPIELAIDEKFGKLRKIDPDFHSVNRFAELIGISHHEASKYIKMGMIKTEIRNGNDGEVIKVPASEVKLWNDFKNEYISFKDIMNKYFLEDVELGTIKSPSVFVLNLKRYIADQEYEVDQFDIVDVEDTPFHFTNYFFVRNEHLCIIVEILKERIARIRYKTPEEKIAYSLGFVKDFKDTKSDIDDLISEKMMNTNGAELYGWLDCTRTFGSALKKELHMYNEDELKLLVKEMDEKLKSRVARQFLSDFIKYTKKNNDCMYEGNFIYDPKKDSVKDVSPYTMEQMGRMAILVFNETHNDYDNRVKLAIERSSYACTWLYVALHYVCSWRKSDMMFNLPRITLPVKKYEDFFDLVKNGEFTKEMAEKITKELEDKISVLDLQPMKTEGRTNQELILDIPESAREVIGMLLGLCEAHIQKNHGENADNDAKYIGWACNYTKNYGELFGEEYYEIFGENNFSNLKGNKFYLINIAEIAEKEEYGTGYIMASLARAHRFTLEDKSDTTAIYLKYFEKLTDSDKLMKELFERGVCSFIPYMALKITNGEDVRKLKLEEQTKLIKRLPAAVEIEDITKEFSYTLETARDGVERLISIFKDKDEVIWEEEVKKFIKRLCDKSSNGKDEGVRCILLAQGKGCKYKVRENCIGCGEEIYLKSAFHVLGEKYNTLRKSMLNSETKASAIKYKFIIDNVLAPIVSSFRVCLKEIYKIENMSEYQNIYLGRLEKGMELI